MRWLRSAKESGGELEPDYAAKSSPKILTRNTQLPALSALDAGDIVECYALTRMAKLESSAGSSSPSNIIVRKSAIAFRYKPKSSSPDVVVKAPFELTLEYGPQRTGSSQSFEAMPSVNGHYRGLEYEDGDGKYVSWENHAKIYYDTLILEEDWDNAYYMAPITGAVLSKVFNDYIMDYPILHPRYQPFNVVEKDSGTSVIPSSNSEDFVWNIFRKLADMYVAIDPILIPKQYEIQLLVEDGERDVKQYLDSNKVLSSEDVGSEDASHERKQNAANYAAEFYHNFFSCIEAMKSGDYSEYETTDSPTLSPSASPTASLTASPTASVTQQAADPDPDPVEEEANASSTGNTNKNKKNKNKKNKNKNQSSTEEDPNSESTIDTPSEEDTSSENGENVEEDTSSKNVADDGGRKLRVLGRYTASEQIENIEAELNNDEPQTPAEVDSNVLPFVDDAKEAAGEAEKAAEKAEEAATNNNDSKAAEAAGVAVEAAKKAFQATTDAADQVAIESLLSGDGSMMASVIQTCFADPKYGITDETNGAPSTTDVYLFLDGSHYHRLNLTAPFVRIIASSQPLPKPNIVPSGKGDVVDIGLAMAIIGGFCFGIIVMLHHIRVLHWDNRLQFKWFFHPTSTPKQKRGGYSNTLNCDTADDNSVGFDEPGEHVELSDTTRIRMNGTLA